MNRLDWVNKKGRSAGRRESSRDFSCDMAAFANTCKNDFSTDVLEQGNYPIKALVNTGSQTVESLSLHAEYPGGSPDAGSIGIGQHP